MEAREKPFLSSSCSNVIRTLSLSTSLDPAPPCPEHRNRALAGLMLALYYHGNAHPMFHYCPCVPKMQPNACELALPVLGGWV